MTKLIPTHEIKTQYPVAHLPKGGITKAVLLPSGGVFRIEIPMPPGWIDVHSSTVEVIRELPTQTAPQSVSKNMSEEEEAALAAMKGAGGDPLAQIFEEAATAVEEAKEPEPEPEPVVLGTNEILLSSITAGKLPDSGIDHVITVYADDFFPEALRADIPEVDENYIWQPDVLEFLWLAHKRSKKAFLSGPPGSGKTTACMQFASILKQPAIRLNGKSGIDASSFLGFLVPSASGAEFKEGMLPVAMRNDYLLVVDEVLKIPAEIMMNFQTVFEESGVLMLDEKPGMLHEKLVHPSPEFRLFVTDNAKGSGNDFDKYGATQVQDSSFLDRINMTMDVDYLPRRTEVRLLRRMYPLLDSDTCKSFVKVARLVREAFNNSDLPITLSPRGLKSMCELCYEGISEKASFKMCYFNKLGEDVERDTAGSFVDTVMLSEDKYVLKTEEDVEVVVEEVKETSTITEAANPEAKPEDLPW